MKLARGAGLLVALALVAGTVAPFVCPLADCAPVDDHACCPSASQESLEAASCCDPETPDAPVTLTGQALTGPAPAVLRHAVATVLATPAPVARTHAPRTSSARAASSQVLLI